MTPDLRASFFNQNWLRVQNGSGEAIPPHAVMRISEGSLSSGSAIITVAKPSTANLSKRHLVNGPFSIAAASTSEGVATFLGEGGAVMVTGTPTLGSTCGPVNGQWHVSSSGSGFTIIGTTTATSGGNTVILAQQGETPSAFFRGVVDGEINKGSTGSVKRYQPGTSTLTSPLITDTVTSDLSKVADGKLVHYAFNGNVLYITAVEKTETAVIQDFGLNSGATAVEADIITAQLETTSSSSTTGKIAVDECEE